MSGIKAASGFVISGGLSANIQPPPKKLVVKEISPDESPVVRTPSENLSSALSARVGLDIGEMLKAKVNALVNQVQDTAAQIGLNPGDIAAPVILAPQKMLEDATELYGDVKTFGRETFESLNSAYGTDHSASGLANLDENDSLRIGGKGGISGGVFGGAQEFGYEIKCTKKDQQTGAVEYTVALEVSPEMKAKLADFEGSAGFGAKSEYKFNSAAEVQRFEQIVSRTNRMVLNSDTGKISATDRQFLKDRTSSVEIKITGGGQYESLFGIKDTAQVGGQVGVKVQNSFKIEYQNGQPVNLVRTTEITGAGALRLGTSPEGVKTKPADGKTALTLETKIPLDAAKITDIPTLIADPINAARLEKAETTIKSVTEIDGGRYGTIEETEISNLSIGDANQIIKNTLLGKLENTLDNIKADVKTKTSSFEDSGLNINLDFEIKGFGFEYEARNEKRDVTVVSGS